MLLSSNVEHVLVNVVNALRILADKTPENQSVIGQQGAITTLIELLGELFNYIAILFLYRDRTKKGSAVSLL